VFFVNFDQHDVYLIEADGVEIEPLNLSDTELGLLTVSVAQRYSVLVEAKNATDKNYALSVLQSPDMYDAVPDTLVLNNTLQIVYADSNPDAEAIEFDEFPVLNDSKFVPILKQEQAPADVEYRLDVFFDTYDNGMNRASFNNVTYQSPIVPSIFTALSMGENSLLTQVYGAQTNAFAYKLGQNIQLTVYNWDAGFHPFHLHG
jgi:iron transport multicopper oxidase